MSLDPQRPGRVPERLAWLAHWLQRAEDEICTPSAEEQVAVLLGVSADNPACRLFLALQQRGTTLDAMDLEVFRAWAAWCESPVVPCGKKEHCHEP